MYELNYVYMQGGTKKFTLYMRGISEYRIDESLTNHCGMLKEISQWKRCQNSISTYSLLTKLPVINEAI